MVVIVPELFSSTTRTARQRVWPEKLAVVKFATKAGGPTLAAGEVVAFNTSTNLWVPWANGGANGTGTVRGIVWPNPALLSATGETLHWVMFAGRVHFDDLLPITIFDNPDALTTGSPSLRELGIYVEGLAGVH